MRLRDLAPAATPLAIGVVALALAAAAATTARASGLLLGTDALRTLWIAGAPTRHAFGIAAQPTSEPTENAVLVEWALGRSVERWTRELAALATP